ncbi:hypothetical protein G9A89_002859 [Geosiphon pyriformis]|nr:hypothetical protein G9A89_002859 [Geosiphon pyriformis]
MRIISTTTTMENTEKQHKTSLGSSLLLSCSRFFKFETFNPELSTTSWFIRPKTLLIIRILFALYGLIVLASVSVDLIKRRNVDLIFYFTYLSFIGLVSYFLLAIFYSCKYIRRRNLCLPKYLNFLFWTLYHTICHYHFIVSIVYWLFLAHNLTTDTPLEVWWRNVSLHAVNALMMCIEVALNRQVMVWPFFLITISFILLFMFEAWVVHLWRNFWVYEFLSWENGIKAIYWYIGMYFFFMLVYVIQVGVHRLRDKIGKKCGNAENGLQNELRSDDSGESMEIVIDDGVVESNYLCDKCKIRVSTDL